MFLSADILNKIINSIFYIYLNHFSWFLPSLQRLYALQIVLFIKILIYLTNHLTAIKTTKKEEITISFQVFQNMITHVIINLIKISDIFHRNINHEHLKYEAILE